MTTDIAAAVAAETTRQAQDDERPLPPIPPRPGMPGQDTLVALLDRAKRNPSKRIQNAAKRAEDAVQSVRDLMAEDAGKAEARERVARLERELRDAKAALRKPTSARPAVDAKAVRAWAKDNGVDCPAVGRVPAPVVEAFHAARKAS